MTDDASTLRVTIDLTGQVAVVTGSGTSEAGLQGDGPLGIGSATALQFVLAGARVALMDRDAAALDRTLELLRRHASPQLGEGRVIACQGDVTSIEDAERVVAAAAGELGQVTALVNNAAIAGAQGTAIDVDLDDWRRTIEVNLTSMVVMSRAVLPQMLGAGAGSIVNVSSVAGMLGGHHSLAYPVAKQAVIGLTRTMAAHHGPAGVRVNVLVPGLAYSAMVHARRPSAAARAARSAAAMIPREGTPWDVAAGASYLISDAARWVTAVVLPVDGGLSALSTDLGIPVESVEPDLMMRSN